MVVQVRNNAKDLANVYERRAMALMRTKNLHARFAMTLHEIRKKNLQKMVYDRTPYSDVSKHLLDSEVVISDAVYNTASYASIRAKMTGDYVISPGTSKEADWPKISFEEAMQSIRVIEVAAARFMNVNQSVSTMG